MRNLPCPCGSGRKYKKCCGAPGAAPLGGVLPHNQADRTEAFSQLEHFVEEFCGEADDAAFEGFWGHYLDREELPEEFDAMSNGVYEAWFAFDHDVGDGVRVADEFLDNASPRRGVRAFLEAMRASSMRLYEVMETVPGSSVTLRDVIEGDEVTVAERSASRQLVRHECIAGRVLPRGCSGQPELERGVLRTPELVRAPLIEEVGKRRQAFLKQRPGASLADFYKSLPPLDHEAWLTCFFDPPVPELANTDGEALVHTRVSYEVLDEAALLRALDAAGERGLARSAGESWSWAGKSSSGEMISLGTLALTSGRLELEVDSVERGWRGRALLEELAGALFVHRATTHEDVRRKL